MARPETDEGYDDGINIGASRTRPRPNGPGRDRRGVTDLMSALQDELQTFDDQLSKHGSVISLILRPEEEENVPGELATIAREESGLNDYLAGVVDHVRRLRLRLGHFTERVDL